RGDKSFLGDADLDMTGDELLYIKDKYSLFMYTITGKSREGNQRIRDRLLDMLTDPKVVKVYQRFEDFQAGLLEEVCMQRFNDELIVAEEIEVTSNKYCIMWDYLTRRREPVLQEVIGKNEELMNALTILESEEDMLYAGFTFNHNGESVSVTLSEPTTTYREGRLITPEGKSLDGTEYNSFSLTIWSKDRKLNAKYRDKIKAYFSRYDLRKVRAPRHFIDESFSYLENSLMQMNEQEK
ncbi:hypothetical protein KY336_02075, partial [Candidatus Woesearchaeota archaeon]|nr:hypothetical protein [Candidatus Woesearchaeota archaeon]